MRTKERKGRRQKRGEGGALEIIETSSFQSTKLRVRRREERGTLEMARRGRAWGVSPGEFEYLLERSHAMTRGFAGEPHQRSGIDQ